MSITILRLALTAGLLVNVYSEVGPWTFCTLVLMTAGIELTQWQSSLLRGGLMALAEAIDALGKAIRHMVPPL